MNAACFGRRVLQGCLCLLWVTSNGCGKKSSPDVTLTVLGFDLEAGRALRADALDEFTRATGVSVGLIPTLGTSSDQLGQTRRLLTEHASTPDVYLIDVVWPGTIGEGLLDLKPYEDKDTRGHIPALLANDTVQGRLVSLPLYVNIGMLYYRADLLAKYGFAHPPATWDELERMSRKIQQGERAAGNQAFWGFVWQGAAYEGLTCNALEWQASYGGGRIIEADGTISINNPHTAEALRMAAGWVGGISPPTVLSYTEADSLNVFRAGNAAFLRYWSGRAEPRSGGALLPAGPHGRAQAMGGFHLGVSRYSRYPREAARLVLYLTSGAVQLRRAIDRGRLPTIPELYHHPAVERTFPYAGALQTAGAAAWVSRPSTIAGKYYAMVSQAYYQTVHRVLSHESAPKEALATLERKLVELTGLRTGAPSE